jgi:hypothetical protein
MKARLCFRNRTSGLSVIKAREILSLGPSGEAGFSIGIVLVFLLLMMVGAIVLFMLGSQDASLAAAGIREAQALFVAESGVEVGRAWLEAQDTIPTTIDTLRPVGESPVALGNGSFTVYIIPDPWNPSLNSKLFTIVSRATVQGRTREIEVVVSPDFYSNYLYFTDKEHEPGGGSTVWFTSTDVVDGPLYTNDQVSIHGDPTFMGAVSSGYGGPDDSNTSHEPLFLYYNGDENNHVESGASDNAPYDNPTFMDGYVLGDSEVDYPTHSLSFDIKHLAQDGGISIAGDYEIELSRPDDDTGLPMYGYVSYRKQDDVWNDVEISSFNGIFYVNGGFSVSGELDGQLTLATNGSVRITDDVTYRDSDENGPCEGCDDLLGIVAGTDINVAWNEPNSDDCVIHAALMALNNSFRAESWNTGDPRGSLTVWGSIIQSFRGAVGTSYIDGDGNLVILTGYEKDYHYDVRLLGNLPPGFYEFIATGMYARVSWREVPLACEDGGGIVPLE